MPNPWLLGQPGVQGPLSLTSLCPTGLPSVSWMDQAGCDPTSRPWHCCPPHLELLPPIINGSLHHLFPVCSARLSLPVLTHLSTLSSASFFFTHYHLTYHSLYLFIYCYLSQQKLKEEGFYLFFFYPPFLKEGLTHARHSIFVDQMNETN